MMVLKDENDDAKIDNWVDYSIVHDDDVNEH